MFISFGKFARELGLTSILFALLFSIFLPLQVAIAQSRTLPDFTDLVEQVGPSVVNIRTMEKVSTKGQLNPGDDEMLELFKRFGLPAPK
jgi:serine protease Do